MSYLNLWLLLLNRTLSSIWFSWSFYPLYHAFIVFLCIIFCQTDFIVFIYFCFPFIFCFGMKTSTYISLDNCNCGKFQIYDLFYATIEVCSPFLPLGASLTIKTPIILQDTDNFLDIYIYLYIYIYRENYSLTLKVTLEKKINQLHLPKLIKELFQN